MEPSKKGLTPGIRLGGKLKVVQKEKLDCSRPGLRGGVQRGRRRKRTIGKTKKSLRSEISGGGGEREKGKGKSKR